MLRMDRISKLVEREYGSVSLRSNCVAELVHEAVSEAKSAVRCAAEARAKTIEAAKRGLDGKTSAFIAWAAKHDVNVKERGDQVTLKFGELDSEEHRKEVKRLLREGADLWEQAKRDPAVFRAGTYRYRIEEAEHQLRSIEAETMFRTITGTVWDVLQ